MEPILDDEEEEDEESLGTTVITLVLVFSFFLNYCICAPLIVYHLKKYQYKINHVFIQKRNPKTVILFNLVALAHLLIGQPLLVLAASSYEIGYDMEDDDIIAIG